MIPTFNSGIDRHELFQVLFPLDSLFIGHYVLDNNTSAPLDYIKLLLAKGL
jgi:hypothetical protein